MGSIFFLENDQTNSGLKKINCKEFKKYDFYEKMMFRIDFYQIK